MDPLKILFVCAGNICRSPLAEGIFRHLAAAAGRDGEFAVDSAGTGGWHQGEPPDRRSVAVAGFHGVDISAQRARRIVAADFGRFDIILAMDRANLDDLLATAPRGAGAEIHLFTAFAGAPDEDIPDPYYRTRQDFEMVYAMLFAGCSAILERVVKDRAS